MYFQQKEKQTNTRSQFCYFRYKHIQSYVHYLHSEIILYSFH